MTRRERFRDTKNRQIERVHARFATLEKDASAFSFKVKIGRRFEQSERRSIFCLQSRRFAKHFPKPYN
jgi:hypothetical protein